MLRGEEIILLVSVLNNVIVLTYSFFNPSSVFFTKICLCVFGICA